MTDVAIVAFAQSSVPSTQANEPEMLLPVIQDAVGQVGLGTGDMGFVCSGSSDYLAGQPFSFVAALDAVGPWPPLAESHVEMDGAWALYEALLWLESGDADTALVYAFGKTSPSEVNRTLALQLEPYTVAPWKPDAHSLAGLQARAMLDAGLTSDEELAAIAARWSTDGASNPHAVRAGALTADEVLAEPTTHAPYRARQLPPVTDGAAALVLAAGDRARELTDVPVWITRMDHRIDSHALGARDLTNSVPLRAAAAGAGRNGAGADVVELHTRYPHEQVLVRRALGLGPDTAVTPSGGAGVADPYMATGLVRIGEVASRLRAGGGQRGLAHAQAGPCLQQNLVATMEVR